MTNDMEPSDHKIDLQAIAKTAFSKIARFLVRVVAMGGVVFTLWTVIGSIAYPGWWYAAIVGGGLLRPLFVAGLGNPLFVGGFAYLLSDKIWFVFVLVGVCAAIVFLALLFPKRRAQVVEAVDRWAALIIAGCVFSLVIDSLILFETGSGPDADVWMAMLARGNAGNLVTPEDTIHAPIYFSYLDSDRVAQIYSEIEPELVEQRRILSSEEKSGGTLGVEAGGATVKAESSKSGQSTLEYQRSQFSPSRKCIELVNVTVRNGSTLYYTTREETYRRWGLLTWHRLLESNNLSNEMKQLIAKEDLLAKEEATADDTFKILTVGFVLVEGSFHVTRTDGQVHFEEEFSTLPKRVVFRFALPAKSDSDLFRDGRVMRVFGEVSQPLNSRGVVEIHPLAVF